MIQAETEVRNEDPVAEGRYVLIEVRGTTYGMLAMRDDDGWYRPDVAVLDPATGDVREVIVEGAVTDEAYPSARECLLRAMAHVIV